MPSHSGASTLPLVTSAEASPASPAAPPRACPAAAQPLSRSRTRLLYGCGLAALLALYLPVFIGLINDWSTNPNYSHGFIIPFAVAYFLWRQMPRLRRLPRRPSAWGWSLVVAAQMVYLVGFLGAEFFLQRTSLLLLIAGALVVLFGWRLLQTQLFNLTLLFLAIPLPALLFNAIAFPLQLLASSWASSLLYLVHLPVFREGNILVLPQRTLDVAEACSGIRSLFSLLALAMMVAYFLPARFWLRLFLVLSAVPIALAANAFRIAATGVLGQWFGAAASEGFFHAFSGWLIFVVALLALMAEAALLHRWLQRRHHHPLPQRS